MRDYKARLHELQHMMARQKTIICNGEEKSNDVPHSYRCHLLGLLWLNQFTIRSNDQLQHVRAFMAQ